MRTTFTLLLLCMATLLLIAQDKKALEKQKQVAGQSLLGIQDRAGGLHNKSNIGEFFENRGKLYARTAAQGPSGEYPIGSGREYIYRINPMIGIQGNVIQGRYTTNEEWEAAAGYHNRDSAKIAFSDKPYTWPATGWPKKNSTGDPIFISDQDSYCVYNDSNNTKQVLGIEVRQTGYAFGLKLVKDMIFFTYEVINKSQNTYNDMYFGIYMDLDIGDMSGGVAEYGDDRLGFNRPLNLLYFYDSDHASTEWPGSPPGYFGYAFLKTPVVNGAERGLTDFHYNLYDDDLDRDSIQYGILSSASSLQSSSLGPKYFHLGSNPSDRHFDDTATVPLTGLDLVANMSSGPYTMRPGDTLTFVTVMVAGADLENILQNTQRARDLMNLGYVTARPPEPAPTIKVIPGDKKVFISWDGLAERARDKFSGNYDFEGYRLYKSIDLGQHWDQIDRNVQPNVGPDPVPLAEFDKIDGVGDDTGLQYSFVDSSVINGLEYWYSITAYDKGDSATASLENPRGNNTEAPNLGTAIPRSSALGRLPVGIASLSQSGTGNSNVVIAVQPSDIPDAADRTYKIQFRPSVSIERGGLTTPLSIAHQGAGSTADKFSITFQSATTYRVRNLSTNSIVVPSGTHTIGTPITFSGLSLSLADQGPQAGDSLVIQPGIMIVSGSAEFMALRPLLYNSRQSTTNGIVVTLTPINPIQSIQQTAGSNPVTVSTSITNASLVPDATFKLNFISVFGDSGRLYAKVQLKNGDSLVTQRDSLKSGDVLTATGFTLQVTMTVSARPAANTVVQIVTVRQRPATYADEFTFTTVAARTNSKTIAARLDNIKVVPNPYRASSLYEREFGALRREPIRQLKFNNLPPKCTIYIFSVAGDKVQTLEHDSDNGTETWDLRGAGGRVIAPGIYLFLVKSDAGEKLGRFAVIK